MKHNNFLSILDLGPEEIQGLVFVAMKLKTELKTGKGNRDLLKKKILAMVFEKPSLRTRVSFEVGMKQLGGDAFYITGKEIGIGTRESLMDIAKVLSGMSDAIMIRSYSHKTIEDIALYADVPVINGLSDLEHPCQILADIMTIYECMSKKGSTLIRLNLLKGFKIAFIGDGENNVTHSLALICGMLGIDFVAASPSGYFMNPKVYVAAKQLAFKHFSTLEQVSDPRYAVVDADVVYTDTWVSMGDEREVKTRSKAFFPYQVTSDLMRFAKKDAIFMHDMPAYRGKEVATEVIDGPQSVIYQQAENRLHMQKALLLYLLKS